MLALPMQPRDAHLPFDGAEGREGGQRLGDLAQRFRHRRVTGRVEPRQAERRPDRAERAVDPGGVESH